MPTAFATGSCPVSLGGAVEKPLCLTAGELRALPAAELSLTLMAGSRPETGSYKGVPLWKLLELASVKSRRSKGANLLHTIVVTGRDSYAVALAIAEIDPRFEGKAVLLAYDQDGRPLRNGFRLVVPGDQEGGRSVRDVVRIEVR
jgi:DMSO/TMAO reductase YedYZ molybdopterin-dependent catalytic subunit